MINTIPLSFYKSLISKCRYIAVIEIPAIFYNNLAILITYVFYFDASHDETFLSIPLLVRHTGLEPVAYPSQG